MESAEGGAARPGPRRLPGRRGHADARHRRRTTTAVAGVRLLEAVPGVGRPACAGGWAARPPGRCRRAGLARGHDDHGEHPRQVQRPAHPPRPRGRPGDRRAARPDAAVQLLPVGSLGGRLRLRHGGGSPVAGRRRPPARPRRARGVLPRTHGGALPRGRHRRFAAGGCAGPGDQPRRRGAAAAACPAGFAAPPCPQ